MFFSKFSTIQRVLFCLAVSNAGLIFIMLLFAFRFELNEMDFIFLSSGAGIINFFWVWLLLRKSFDIVEQVTNNIHKIIGKEAAVKHGYEDSENFKLQTGGLQKEVQDLVDAFNRLVDQIHVSAEESNKIIHESEDLNKNGD